jgi:hypothetical protein
MSATADRLPAATSPGPSVALVRLGLALSSFLAISFLLCALGELIPGVKGIHLLHVLYPDVDWSRPTTIGLGLLWSVFTGWYVALVFGGLYNFFAPKSSARS